MKDINKTIEEVNNLIKSDNSKIYYVGKKDPKKRVISKFKLGIATVMASIGLSSFGLMDLKNIDNQLGLEKYIEQPMLVKESSVNNVNLTRLDILEDGLSKQVKLESSPLTIRDKYPSVNFENIKNTRDISKEFLGVNNFISLASEMEGFRGDLHKDPAVGLNIGFGYNITKRVQENKPQVIDDLSFIGFSKELVDEIIDLSQVPQAKLSKSIKDFNRKHELKNNQLITLEQGVGLLDKTQEDYKSQAERAFGESFSKMGKNQQEVLTYAAYKAGYEALSKYKKAIRAANEIYSKEGEKGLNEFKKIAKEIKFYYKKDGKEWVLDERAALIAHTFVSPDYLALEIGASKKLSLSQSKLSQNKLDFSHLPKNLNQRVSSLLEKFRNDEVIKENTFKMG